MNTTERPIFPARQTSEPSSLAALRRTGAEPVKGTERGFIFVGSRQAAEAVARLGYDVFAHPDRTWRAVFASRARTVVL